MLLGSPHGRLLPKVLSTIRAEVLKRSPLQPLLHHKGPFVLSLASRLREGGNQDAGQVGKEDVGAICVWGELRALDELRGRDVWS